MSPTGEKTSQQASTLPTEDDACDSEGWIEYSPETHQSFAQGKNVGLFTGVTDMPYDGGIARIGSMSLVTNDSRIGKSDSVKEALARSGEHSLKCPSRSELNAKWDKMTDQLAERFGAASNVIKQITMAEFGNGVNFWIIDEPSACSLFSKPNSVVLTTAPVPPGSQTGSTANMSPQTFGRGIQPVTAKVVHVVPNKTSG